MADTPTDDSGPAAKPKTTRKPRTVKAAAPKTATTPKTATRKPAARKPAGTTAAKTAAAPKAAPAREISVPVTVKRVAAGAGVFAVIAAGVAALFRRRKSKAAEPAKPTKSAD